jgi:hypothetical protein
MSNSHPRWPAISKIFPSPAFNGAVNSAVNSAVNGAGGFGVGLAPAEEDQAPSR